MWLSIDCANFQVSLALGITRLEALTWDTQYHPQELHSLLPRVEELLQHHHATFSQLSGIITTTGPGSFTGVRLGLAMASGLQEALGIPLKTLTSFQAVRSWYARPCWVLLDAGRDELFAQSPDGQDYNLTSSMLRPLVEKMPAPLVGNGATELLAEGFEGTDKMPHATDFLDFLKHANFPWSAPLPHYGRAPHITAPKKIP